MKEISVFVSLTPHKFTEVPINHQFCQWECHTDVGYVFLRNATETRPFARECRWKIQQSFRSGSKWFVRNRIFPSHQSRRNISNSQKLPSFPLWCWQHKIIILNRGSRTQNRYFSLSPPSTRAISQWTRSLEWRQAVTLHTAFGKNCITFFPFSCEACSLYLVLWLWSWQRCSWGVQWLNIL